MPADRPGVPLYARLDASEADSGARVVRGDESPSGARSADRVGITPATDTPPGSSSSPQGAPQPPNAAQGQPPAQHGAQSRTGRPQQLALPPELLAAMTLPVAIPSARRRGRPVHCTPDIANYQPKETQ